MAEKKAQTNAADELRMLAEEIAGIEDFPDTGTPEALSAEETRRLLHELRVHQIELTMQNKELRRAQVDLETSRAHYFDLHDLAPVGYCTLSEKGLILEANLTTAALLGVGRGTLINKPFSQFILKEDKDSYYLHHKRLSGAVAPHDVYETRMLREVALIEIGGYLEGNECFYFVKDNGAGFDMPYYDKLFGVFQRLHSDNDYEGTGIGLALIKRIINRHSGRIWAEGEVDRCATVLFHASSLMN